MKRRLDVMTRFRLVPESDTDVGGTSTRDFGGSRRSMGDSLTRDSLTPNGSQNLIRTQPLGLRQSLPSRLSVSLANNEKTHFERQLSDYNSTELQRELQRVGGGGQ